MLPRLAQWYNWNMETKGGIIESLLGYHWPHLQSDGIRFEEETKIAELFNTFFTFLYRACLELGTEHSRRWIEIVTSRRNVETETETTIVVAPFVPELVKEKPGWLIRCLATMFALSCLFIMVLAAGAHFFYSFSRATQPTNLVW